MFTFRVSCGFRPLYAADLVRGNIVRNKIYCPSHLLYFLWFLSRNLYKIKMATKERFKMAPYRFLTSLRRIKKYVKNISKEE